MTLEKHVDTLWAQLERAIDASTHDGEVLSDYKSTAWQCNLDSLLKTATAEERQHRSGMYSGQYRGSARFGAKVIMLSNVADGAALKSEPLAKLFLMIRRSAAEAMTLGYYLRADLTPEYIAAAQKLDYSDIMNGKQNAA